MNKLLSENEKAIIRIRELIDYLKANKDGYNRQGLDIARNKIKSVIWFSHDIGLITPRQEIDFLSELNGI